MNCGVVTVSVLDQLWDVSELELFRQTFIYSSALFISLMAVQLTDVDQKTFGLVGVVNRWTKIWSLYNTANLLLQVLLEDMKIRGSRDNADVKLIVTYSFCFFQTRL